MTDAWGIDDGYHDIAGDWHGTSDETRAHLRRLMGGEADQHAPPDGRPLWFVRPGEQHRLERPEHLTLEDGTDLGAVQQLPPDLPLGYHELQPDGDRPATRLIVVPARNDLADGIRTWVLCVQLYACRSHHSWGIGDLGDLGTITRWAAEMGAGVVAVNPLHAPRLAPHPQPSPYYPSSRRWRDPLMIDVEAVPGAATDHEVRQIATEVRSYLTRRIVDRAGVWSAKRVALEHLWHRFRGDPDFDAFRAAGGEELERFAAFCALEAEYGAGWPEWPEEYRDPAGPGLPRLAANRRSEIGFHCWLQWLLDRQLRAVGSTFPLLGDLAVGFDPGGFDAWEWQELLALDARIGAPPDEFNPDGQDWGLPPFVPWKLRAAGYEPLIRTLRANLAHVGALRIDHAMGLFRLFWVLPEGGGAYVRFPGRELLDLVVLEATRADVALVGEDLGTVEDEVRRQLSEAGVLSTKVWWFEDRPPSEWPTQAFATVTTHDLPTIVGVITGADAKRREEAGLDIDAAADNELRGRLPDDLGHGRELVDHIHTELAAAPPALVGVTLDDLALVAERPNVPGTTDQLPNWSLLLPVALDDLLASDAVRASAQTITNARGQD